jgi:hypothetical protein
MARTKRASNQVNLLIFGLDFFQSHFLMNYQPVDWSASIS